MKYSYIFITLMALAIIIWSSIYTQAEHLSVTPTKAAEPININNQPINYYIDSSTTSR